MPVLDPTSAIFIDTVTQLEHFFLTFALVMIFAVLAVVFSPYHTKRGHSWLYGGILLVEAFAIIKESMIDPVLEQNPFFWNGATDLLFLTLGTVAGAMLGIWFYRKVQQEYRPRRRSK